MFVKYLGRFIILILFLTMNFCVDLSAANHPSSRDQTKQRKLAIGTSAPSFDLSTIDNRKIALKDFKGRVTAIVFWATWCGPCKPVLAKVASTYQKHHIDGFDVIAFSLDKEPEILRDYLQEHKFPWRHHVWLEDGIEMKNEIFLAYGVNHLPTVYLVGRDGKIMGKNFIWADDRSQVAQGYKPLFQEAVKELLSVNSFKTGYQFDSWVGGVVSINGVPIDDLSTDIIKLDGANAGKHWRSVQTPAGCYAYHNIPTGRWLLRISFFGGMHSDTGNIELIKKLNVLRNIQWHNYWLTKGSCTVECSTDGSYVMFLRRWYSAQMSWIVYAKHRQIITSDKKILERNSYDFKNIHPGKYEYRMCSQIGDGIYVHGGKIEVKPGKTNVIAVEKPERSCRIYGKITNFDPNLAKPVIFVRNAQADSIKYSSFYEMGVWDAVAVVRGEGVKSDGQYECSHLPVSNYVITAAQFKDFYYGIPIVQQSKPVSIDSENSVVMLNFDFASKVK